MERLQKHLWKLKLKLSFEQWYQIFLKCSIIAMFLSILYLILSKWKYLCDSRLFFIILIFFVFFVSSIITFLKRITWQKTAQTADKLGYEERFITALELLEQNKAHSNIEKMVIEDAIQKAQEDIEKKYLLTVPKKELQLIALLFAIMFSTNVISTKQQREAEQYAAAQLRKIEEVKSEINREQKFEEDALKAFQKEIDNITKNLKRAQTVEESKKILEEAQQALKALEKESIPEDLKKTAEKLSKHEKTKELANALERGDTPAINAQMDALLSELENLPQEKLEQISEALEDIGELNDQELKELLDNLSQQLSSGNMAQAVSKGQALKGKLAALSSETAELTKSLENLNQELAQAASSKTEQSGQSGTQGNGMGQGQGEGEQRCDSLDSEKLSQ